MPLFWREFVEPCWEFFSTPVTFLHPQFCTVATGFVVMCSILYHICGLVLSAKTSVIALFEKLLFDEDFLCYKMCLT